MLKPGGRTAFLVIEPVAGLTGRQRRRAARCGPVAVSVPTSYPSLLSTCGFTEVVEQDFTPEFRETQVSWFNAYANREAELKDVIGTAVFEERQTGRGRVVQAIDSNILRRTLYVADRPRAKR